MSEIIVVKNGDFVPETKDGLDKLKLYEVIRLVNGCPLFLEDHLQRLQSSAEVMNAKLWMSEVQIAKSIEELVDANEKNEGNIKFEFEFLPHERKSQFSAKFIPHSYPTTTEYAKGVKVETMRSQRNNPMAKVENLNMRSKAGEQIDRNKLYEVLLVDDAGNVTEGSRSNFFFISENKIYTAPSTDILHGITYLKVLDLCRQKGINIIEEKIPEKDLNLFQAAFITGTSPMILPIQSINAHLYTVHSILMQEIAKGYQQMVSSYIYDQKHK